MYGTIKTTLQMSGSISGGNNAAGSIGATKIIKVTPDRYSGSLSITPSDEAQNIPTSGKYLQNDIVVEAIPSNYGKITWDGYTLTVS